MRYSPIAGVVFFFFLYFVGFYRPTETINPQQHMVMKAPSFLLPEINGGNVDSESFHGRPMLLLFWTMSVGESRRELPVVSQLAPEFREKGIAVVAIHMGGDVNLKEFLQSNKIAMTSLIDVDSTTGEDYGVYKVPKVMLVGADGMIKHTSDGFAGEGELRKWLD